MTSTNSREAAIESAFGEYLLAIDAGEPVDKAAFLTKYPEIADSLAKHLQADSLIRTMAGPSFADTQNEMPNEMLNTVIAPTTEDSAIQQTASFVEAAESIDTKSEKPNRGFGIPETFGRYRVEKILGQGAMGAVYLAHDTQLDRPVALKIPKFAQEDDQDLLERFYREARAVATLHHPNICPVYDAGEIEGQVFLSMAFIKGRPLSDFIKAKKKQGERSVAKLVMKLAHALQEAHEIGVVHRDLKPANIMVGKKGEPVVMDFGLARKIDSNETQITQFGTIVGTPAYMSPEQVEGHPDSVGPLSDQYSLGVILYELLAGRLPFSGTVLSVIGQIAHKEPDEVAELRPDLDPRLAAICTKMMSKNPEDRYNSMTAAAEALTHYLTESKTGADPHNQSLWDASQAEPSSESIPAVKQHLPKTQPAPRAKRNRKRRTKPQKSASKKKLWAAIITSALALIIA